MLLPAGDPCKKMRCRIALDSFLSLVASPCPFPPPARFKTSVSGPDPAHTNRRCPRSLPPSLSPSLAVSSFWSHCLPNTFIDDLNTIQVILPMSPALKPAYVGQTVLAVTGFGFSIVGFFGFCRSMSHTSFFTSGSHCKDLAPKDAASSEGMMKALFRQHFVRTEASKGLDRVAGDLLIELLAE